MTDIKLSAAVAIVVATTLSIGPVGAAETRPSDPATLAANATTKVTTEDYETELRRLPPDMRFGFAVSAKRVGSLLENLLIRKTLAQDARRDGIESDPEVQRTIRAETDRMLAQLYLQRVDERTAADFERKKDEFVSRARELYLLDPKKYARPAQVSVSHILFATDKRGEKQALEAANEARKKLVAGASFAELATQLSDDEGTKGGGGHVGAVVADQMDAAFVKGALALTKTGEISEPVLSSFGYHLIRLDDRQPAKQLTFDEAKGTILAEIKSKYVQDQREARIDAIRSDAALQVNWPAVDALVKTAPPIPAKPR